MLISRIGSPPSNVTQPPGNSQESYIGDRKTSLSHLWWVLEGEMTGVAENSDFVASLDCNVLDISERDWMPSSLSIRNDGSLQLYLRNIDEPFATVKLPESSLVGRIGQPILQISSLSQNFLISCEPCDFGRLFATLHAWTRLRPAGLAAKMWKPPITKMSDPDGEILKCEIEAHFTACKPQMMKWAPFLARLKRSGEFELFNLDDERVFSLQIRDVLHYRVRHVDSSLVGSNLVILLFPDLGGPDSVYIRFTDVSDFEDWFATLKAFSQHFVASPLNRDPKKSVRLHRSICVSISAGRQEPKETESLKDAYVDICLNHWISSRTCVSAEPSCASWGQCFDLVDPEPAAKSGSSSPSSKPITSTPVELKLRRLTSTVASEHDTVLGSTTIKEFDTEEAFRWRPITPGISVCVSTVEKEIPVLDSSHYSELQKWVENLDLRLATRLISSSSSSATKMCNIFTELYRSQGRQTEWILSLVDEEVPKIDPNSATVFRGTSPLSRALEAHLQQQGATVLQRTIGRFIRKLLAGGDASLELDPARLEPSADVKRNQIAIGHYLSYLWSLIQAEGVPMTFNVIFSHLREKISESLDLPTEEISKQVNRTLSAFVFLRFYCPALLNPQLFNLTDRILEPRQRRTTVLIAKMLQGFANGVRFGAKESWLMPMNSFIDDHEDELSRWYTKISQVETNNPDKHKALHRHTESVISPSGDRAPKELPFEPFMGNQLSNPNLVDEWAAYAQLANVVVNLSEAEPRFKEAMASDESIGGFTEECIKVVSTQKKILEDLTAADTIENSKARLTADLVFNKETMLFSKDADLIERDSSLKTPTLSVKSSASVGSRLAWFAKDKPASELSADNSVKSTTSKRKWTNVLRRGKH